MTKHVVTEIDGKYFHLAANFLFPGGVWTVMLHLPVWINLESGEMRNYDGTAEEGAVMPENALVILRRGAVKLDGWHVILVLEENYQRLLRMVAQMKKGIAEVGEGETVVVVEQKYANLRVLTLDEYEDMEKPV